MASVFTSSGTAARRARQSVELTRAQLTCVALLIVVPLPALSLGALVVPLPQLMERAAAGFIPFGPPDVEALEPRAVDRAPAAPAPRKRRATVRRSVPTPPSLRSAQPRSSTTRSGQKRATRAVSPAAVTVKAPLATSATSAGTPEMSAPQVAPAASSAVESPSSRGKPGKGSGSERKAPTPKNPASSAAPPASSAPGANGGLGSDGEPGGGSGESNAGGNGNGNANGNDNSGNGSGKDGH